jgi:hypothetical protein
MKLIIFVGGTSGSVHAQALNDRGRESGSNAKEVPPQVRVFQGLDNF